MHYSFLFLCFYSWESYNASPFNSFSYWFSMGNEVEEKPNVDNRNTDNSIIIMRDGQKILLFYYKTNR